MLRFSTSNADRNYFYFIVVLGRLLGLLPLQTKTSELAKFVWKSKEVAYSILQMAGITAMTLLCVYHLFENGLQFVHFGKC